MAENNMDVLLGNNSTFAPNNTLDQLSHTYSTIILNHYSTVHCLALLSLFASLVAQYFRNRPRPRHSRLPPGPPATWPVLGSLLEMWRSDSPPAAWIHGFMKRHETDIACFRLGNTHVVVVSSPELALEFLQKNDLSFASRPDTPASRAVSGGFLTTALTPWGDQWKKMRRVLVSEILSRKRMKWLSNVIKQEADDLIRFVYNHCSTNSKGDQIVNVGHVMLQFLANVMRRLIFGKKHFGEGKKDDNDDDDGGPVLEDEEHLSSIFALLHYLYAFCVSDYLPWLRKFDFDCHQKRVREALKIVGKYQDPIVADRAKQWREGTKTLPEDLLDLFLSLKDSDGTPLLSDEEIRAQIMELFLAGVDNPYNAAHWALSEMLNQPELIEKAVEELDQVVGKDRLLQESDISSLPYVVACAREALRLHPVVPFNLPHVSIADCTVAGFFVPKGSHVLLSRLGLGRNPKVWDDPLRFDPGRHLMDDRVDLAEAELRFVSFTRGRRGCVGSGIGTNMTVMLLGRLLQGFTWAVPEGLDKIDLSERRGSLLKAEPLRARAKPRLNPSAYCLYLFDIVLRTYNTHVYLHVMFVLV